MDWIPTVKLALSVFTCFCGLLFLSSWATSGIVAQLRSIAEELKALRQLRASQFRAMENRRQLKELAKQHPPGRAPVLDDEGLNPEAQRLLANVARQRRTL